MPRSRRWVAEEYQRIQSLVLRGWSNRKIDRQMGKKRCDFQIGHFDRVTLAVEVNEASYPTDVRLLGSNAVVPNSDRLADGV